MSSRSQQPEVGARIWAAIRLASRVGEEVEAMVDDTIRLLLSRLDRVPGIRRASVGPRDYTSDEGGWMTLSRAYDVELFRKGARKPSAVLTLEAVLGAAAPSSVVGDTPVLNVIMSAGPEGASAGNFLGLGDNYEWTGWDIDASGCLFELEEKGGREWFERDWCFSVPIAMISDIKALEREVVTPVVALVSGKPSAEAFAAASGVLRFSKIGKNQFAVSKRKPSVGARKVAGALSR